jgi:hypothetical protein
MSPPALVEGAGPASGERAVSAGGAYPGGKRFAFTILDDTDDATVENVRPIYDLLYELGFRTTKTAWPLDCPEGSALFFAAETLQDPGYLEFVRELVERGFELASHGATMESSTRERTEAGLCFLEEAFSVPIRVHCNHGQNLENLYWGSARYRTPLLRAPLALRERLSGKPRYGGHVPGSPYFWGDLCRERFRFVRNFAFAEIDTLPLPPHGPYRLPDTPWVNYWFNTSDAPDAEHFRRLVTRENIDRLHRQGGVCILSTHLGKGFVRGGRVDPQVEDALRYLATLPGWFAPVSDVLEHLLARRGDREITRRELYSLELRHAADRVRSRILLSRQMASAR